MRKQPLVSIITPTYNHENFIRQCIEKVLAQTYPNWEQIIVDDGSTDKTGEIVTQYRDERIKYIRQSHSGIWKLGETYNKALQYAQGELIAVLEGDDFWPPYKLEKQLPAFERQAIVLSWGGAIITNSKGETIGIRPGSLRWFKDRPRDEIMRKLLLLQYRITPCTVMCRKDALLSIGGFKQLEDTPCVDTSTWLELGLRGEFFAVDEILGYWRRHKEQATALMAMAVVEAAIKCSIDFFMHMPPELRNSMGVSTNDLLVEYQRYIAVAFFHLGRVAMTESKWEEARRNFREAVNKGLFSIRLKALLGLICSCCRVDLEWVAKIMRKPRLET